MTAAHMKNKPTNTMYYRGYAGTIDVNSSNGKVYIKVHGPLDRPLHSTSYHVSVPPAPSNLGSPTPNVDDAILWTEGAFHNSVDDYILKLNPEPDVTVNEYRLHYTITGLPIKVAGSRVLPTAKDVLLVYMSLLTGDMPKLTENITDGDMELMFDTDKLTAAIASGDIKIVFDLDKLWMTLPQWLQGSINTMIQVVKELGEYKYISVLVDSINLEPPVT